MTILEPRKRGRPRKDAAATIEAAKRPMAQGELQVIILAGIEACHCGPLTQFWSISKTGERKLLWPL